MKSPRISRGARVVGAGFEPAKAEPSGLQPLPFDRFGTPPGARASVGGARLVSEGLGDVAQALRLGQRLELLQRVGLDLADPLARDVELAADLLERLGLAPC